MNGLSHKPAMCFALWMMSRPGEGVKVTHGEVMERWALSSATAYRWLAAYREAKAWRTTYCPSTLARC